MFFFFNDSLLGWWAAGATERKSYFCGISGCTHKARRGSIVRRPTAAAAKALADFFVIPTCEGHAATEGKEYQLAFHAHPTSCPCIAADHWTVSQHRLIVIETFRKKKMDTLTKLFKIITM